MPDAALPFTLRPEQLLDALPYPAWLTPADGSAEHCNPAWLALTGTTAEALCERGVAACWHPDDQGRVQNSPEQTLTAEARIGRAGGTFRWHRCQTRPLRDETGRLLGWLGTATDIDDQKQAEQQTRRADFKLLARATNDVIWDWNLSTNELWRNARFGEQFGYPAAQAPETIDFWRTLLHPDDRAELLSRLEDFLQGPQELLRAEYRLRCADGSYADIVDRIIAVRDEAGHARRLVGAMQNVTRARHQEQLMQQQQEQFRFLADTIPQFIWTARPDGVLDYANQRWEDYTGQHPQEATFENWAPLVHPEDGPRSLEQWQYSLETGRFYENELRFRGRDGQYRWFLVQAQPQRNAQGEIVKWFGSCTDIDERRQAQRKLLRREQYVQRMLSQAPILFAVMRGPEHRFEFASPLFEQLLGSHRGDILGRRLAEAVPELIDQGYISIMDQVYATGQPYVGTEVPVQLLRPHGQVELGYLNFTYQPQLDAQGHTEGLVVIAVDVTAQVLAKQQAERLTAEVAQREEQFRFLAESIPQLIWTNNPAGVADYFNQRWSDYTGLTTTNETLPHYWQELFHPDDQQPAVQRWQQSLDTGIFFEQEVRLRARGGEYRWFLAQALPMRDAAGQVQRWFGSYTDIDDVKSAQQRLLTQNQELTRINQELDSFVYTASHDLIQPINNMAGIFEELTRTAYFRDPDAVKLIAMFERALQQIYTTIHDLAEVVQVQRRQQDVPTEPVLLRELSEEVLTSIRDQISAARAVVETNFSAADSLVCVRTNLQSVFYNLVSNAIKYASPERPPYVRVWSELVAGEFVLSVQDNGLGIDLARYGSQLFQLFRRFHDHTEGSGIGLYLVNRILQGQGGRLEVESTVGEGTTFRAFFGHCRPASALAPDAGLAAGKVSPAPLV
ncbi:PAS domain-containing protein [Hymenobacter sp. BT175]|uniref:PAS domain-containing sensor histidine kinase n=1 Tax=Hymenobacter translucens TaxID=2886507 RepID=UPI001D0EDAC9|nr:PAS domain-containing sensor histidine kinase [Hymenobacter translucens]MCC2547282.1 PAS domain-containing protein [Hymenobacter translucens]